MPVNRPTTIDEIPSPEHGPGFIAEYGIRVDIQPGPAGNRHPDGTRYSVTFSETHSKILDGGTLSDVAILLFLLDAERDRMAREIVADARSGALGDPAALAEFGDLDAVADAGIYPSGGRSVDDAYGDEKHGWSDTKTGAHTRSLLDTGIIGKGVETVDPDDTAASPAFCGFQDASATAVSFWLKAGGLVRALSDASPTQAPSH